MAMWKGVLSLLALLVPVLLALLVPVLLALLVPVLLATAGGCTRATCVHAGDCDSDEYCGFTTDDGCGASGIATRSRTVRRAARRVDARRTTSS